MSCVYSPCSCCNRLVKSTSVAANGTTNIVVTIPATTYQNGERICLCITQAIPTTTTPLPVVIQFEGATGTSYPLINRCGNPVFSDQLRTRRLYHLRVAGSSANFMVCDRLCPTAMSYASISAPTTPA